MQNEPKPSDFCTTFRQLSESGQRKSRLYTRNFVNDYDFGVNERLWRRRLRLSQRLCQRLSRGLSRRLWRRATHGEAAAGAPGRHRRSRGQPPTKPQENKSGGKLAEQAESHGAEDNATPQGHKQEPQNTRVGGGIGIAPNIKTPYRCGKMANRAYGKKAAGIHQKQRKTPHSVSHAGRRQY